jgi:hypothetical protein
MSASISPIPVQVPEAQKESSYTLKVLRKTLYPKSSKPRQSDVIGIELTALKSDLKASKFVTGFPISLSYGEANFIFDDRFDSLIGFDIYNHLVKLRPINEDDELICTAGSVNLVVSEKADVVGFRDFLIDLDKKKRPYARFAVFETETVCGFRLTKDHHFEMVPGYVCTYTYCRPRIRTLNTTLLPTPRAASSS